MAKIERFKDGGFNLQCDKTEAEALLRVLLLYGKLEFEVLSQSGDASLEALLLEVAERNGGASDGEDREA